MLQPRRVARRYAVMGILWSCVLALAALTWLVGTGRAYWWWDFALAHLAAQSADSYTHTVTIFVYQALNVPGDPRVDAVLTLAAMLVLARRRAGWTVLLPLLLLATMPVEYAAKDLIYSPPPTPDVVLRLSAADALPYYTEQSSAPCPAATVSPLGILDDVSCPGGSFLSGAAARIAILTGLALWWTARRRWRISLRLTLVLALVAYLVAAGVGRVYLRWHWPSDVVGGYLLGAICLCIIRLPLVQRLGARHHDRAARPDPGHGPSPGRRAHPARLRPVRPRRAAAHQLPRPAPESTSNHRSGLLRADRRGRARARRGGRQLVGGDVTQR